MKVVILLLVLLLASGGCSKSNVKVSASDESAHETLMKEEEQDNARITTRALVESVPPADFPAESPEPGLEGIIMIRVLVGVDGQPIEATVSQSIHAELDKCALKAALLGRYFPAREGEIPREAWVSVPFRYPPPPPAGAE